MWSLWGNFDVWHFVVSLTACIFGCWVFAFVMFFWGYPIEWLVKLGQFGAAFWEFRWACFLENWLGIGFLYFFDDTQNKMDCWLCTLEQIFWNFDYMCLRICWFFLSICFCFLFSLPEFCRCHGKILTQLKNFFEQSMEFDERIVRNLSLFNFYNLWVPVLSTQFWASVSLLVPFYEL